MADKKMMPRGIPGHYLKTRGDGKTGWEPLFRVEQSDLDKASDPLAEMHAEIQSQIVAKLAEGIAVKLVCMGEVLLTVHPDGTMEHHEYFRKRNGVE